MESPGCTVQAICKGLKKYGMINADNGGDWRISVAPDPRIKGLDDLTKLKAADFEVIAPSGPNEGRYAPNGISGDQHPQVFSAVKTSKPR